MIAAALDNNLDSVAAAMQPTQPNIPSEVTGPDARGEFPSPLAGALWMAAKYQASQIPLQGKVALLPEWPKRASTDPTQIQAWWDEFHGNFGTVGELGRLFMFETDSPSVRERFQALGHDFTAGLVIESRVGREHRYYPSVPGIENVHQNTVKFGDFSIRADAAYCVSPGSVHPITGKQYRVISSGGLTPPTAEEMSFWKSEKKEKEKTKRDPQAAITSNRNSTLLSIGGKYIDLGEDIENVKERIREINQERCTEPLTEEELSKTVFVSLGKYAKNPDYITRKVNESIPLLGGRTAEQLAEDQAAKEEQEEEQEEEQQARMEQEIQEVQARSEQSARDRQAMRERLVRDQQSRREQSSAAPEPDDDDIPEFDESVITGIYRDIVTLAVGGTTIPPQFALLNAKVYFGALLAGRITFEGLDSDSSYYGTAIGETGTSKGESWRRTFEAILHPEFLNLNQSLKVIYSADSGAGLKDCFFEPPREVPVVCYVDEVTTLGHKGGEKKNPEIIDAIVELADSHQVSRVLAKKGKLGGSKTHDNARLSLYICGQDGPAFMSAFAGRTKIGLFDRFYPEFSGPIEAGDLPEINQSDVLNLHAKITALNFNCKKMTMSDATRLDLGIFWSGQPVEIRRKIRFRKYLILDMYMAAFGRGVTVAEPEDLAVAIKMFTRQIIIRKVHFTGEVPDRVGFYLGHLKSWTEWMRKRLVKGESIASTAMSMRDFQTLSHAFRDNEGHIFHQAWRSYHADWLQTVSIIGANGHQYEKFVPIPREDETWLPL
jgi:bifunctional DNA primase/polymerase-like protein/primase-like protein